MLSKQSYKTPDPDLKRRLNAFVQAKARSASPATREPLPPVSRAACTPAKPVVSPRSAAASGRALYQPTFSKSANGEENNVLYFGRLCVGQSIIGTPVH